MSGGEPSSIKWAAPCAAVSLHPYAKQRKGGGASASAGLSVFCSLHKGGGLIYRALYRKWRPGRFDDVVGQQNIIAALQNQVASGRVGHAYLLTGTRGTGKTTCAKIFAKAINCLSPEKGDPCCQCEICRGIDDGSILDVVEIDAASNSGVDNIRDLRDETAYTPSVCRYKVYIIDEVHMLSPAAFNALLKIMEEPPAHLVFILATTEIHKVPATILSRCQRYDFGRIRPEDIAGRILHVARQEGLELDEAAAALIARLADGALRDALSILDTCAGVGEPIDEELVRRMAGVTDKSYLFSLSGMLAAGDAGGALAEVARLRQGSVDMKRLCEELVGHYRNLMLAALPGGKNLLAGVPPEEEALYLEKAASIPQSASVRAIRLLGDAMEKMNRGTDARIELELALFAIAQPAPAAAVTQAPAASAPSQPAPFAAAPAAQSTAWKPAAPARAEQPAAPPPAASGQEPPASPEQEPLPWEGEKLEAQPVPEPKTRAARPAARPRAESGPPCPFEYWDKVLEVLKKRDHMLPAYLKHSKAYYDGRRVLIDGGDLFRDFIRQNKDSQVLLKSIIAEVSGLACGIGPYVAAGSGQQARPTVEQTLKDLEAHGVDVVYNDKQ